MRKLLILCLMAGCSAYPEVQWASGAAGVAPDLFPIDQVLGEDDKGSDAAGALLMAKVAALQARVAQGR